jgi:hypothetical protein
VHTVKAYKENRGIVPLILKLVVYNRRVIVTVLSSVSINYNCACSCVCVCVCVCTCVLRK